MTTVKELIELLSKYNPESIVTNEQNENFIHVVNIESVILSTKKPIGYCNRTGEYVYPSIVKGYSGYCPKLDEDLYTFEFTPFEENHWKEFGNN